MERKSSTHLPILIGIGLKFTNIKNILEYGSGNHSTKLFLDKNVYSNLINLTSFEEDEHWVKICSKFDNNNKLIFTKNRRPKIKNYDLTFIDSLTIDGKIEDIKYVLENKGNIIVIHDTDMNEYKSVLQDFKYKFNFTSYIFNFSSYWPHTSVIVFDKAYAKTLKKIRSIIEANSSKTEAEDIQTWIKLFDNKKNSINSNCINLKNYEKKFLSQFGEDGVIEKIFKTIGTTDKYYVEFGGGSPYDNTRYLREQKNWTGLLMNADSENPAINLKKEHLTKENIIPLFEKYNVPKKFDFLCIDVDGHDWHFWKKIGQKYQPRVVMFEINRSFYNDEAYTIKYDPSRPNTWDITFYYGASLFAFKLLSEQFNYSLVGFCEPVNAFFIHNDCLNNMNFYGQNDLDILFPYGKAPEGKRTAIDTRYLRDLSHVRPDNLKRQWEKISKDNIKLL